MQRTEQTQAETAQQYGIEITDKEDDYYRDRWIPIYKIERVTLTLQSIYADMLEGYNFNGEHMTEMIQAMITFLHDVVTPTEDEKKQIKERVAASIAMAKAQMSPRQEEQDRDLPFEDV